MVLRPNQSAISLKDLAATLNLNVVGDTSITGVTHRSRDVQPGDLFIAIPGFTQHGISHLDEALQRGAVAVATDNEGLTRCTSVPHIVLKDARTDMARISAEVYGHPERKAVIVGVTGTNGKTTVTHMIKAIAKYANQSVGMIGTLGSFINDEQIPSDRTTPESPDLFALFGYMVERGVDVIVMEVSSHALALSRVDGIIFSSSVFTNLTQDHLDFHGDMDSYFAAKKMLFDPKRSHAAVVSVDDEWGTRLANNIDIPCQTVSMSKRDADLWLANLKSTPSGTTFTMHKNQGDSADSAEPSSRLDSETADRHIPLLGQFNVLNSAQAVLACGQIGIDEDLAWEALASMAAVPGRMEIIPVHNDISVVVDYAHTPDAVEKVLHHLRPTAPARLITVLGCGGDRDATKRPLMGSVASTHSDIVIVTDDNPRSENPDDIRADIIRGIHVLEPLNIGDRRTAIRTALQTAHAGDIIAILGKGHEQGQEIAGVIQPFCDQEVIREEALHVFTNVT